MKGMHMFRLPCTYALLGVHGQHQAEDHFYSKQPSLLRPKLLSLELCLQQQLCGRFTRKVVIFDQVQKTFSRELEAFVSLPLAWIVWNMECYVVVAIRLQGFKDVDFQVPAVVLSILQCLANGLLFVVVRIFRPTDGNVSYRD